MALDLFGQTLNLHNITATNVRANVQAAKAVKTCDISWLTEVWVRSRVGLTPTRFNRDMENDHEWPFFPT